jgi:hypothetical protein
MTEVSARREWGTGEVPRISPARRGVTDGAGRSSSEQVGDCRTLAEVAREVGNELAQRGTMP